MMNKKILIVDDEELIRWTLRQKLTKWGYEVIETDNGQNVLNICFKDSPDLVLLDVKLPNDNGTIILKRLKKKFPELPVIMITAYSVIEDAINAFRLGAYDFITKPFNFEELQNTIKNALEAFSLKKEIASYKEKEKKEFSLDQIIGESKEIEEVKKLVKTVAESEASIILLEGESGTGKDLISKVIHYHSRRNNNPYVALNCSALPDALLESELFGYEKGAFTDAKSQKKGLVELADGGTFFLDEISTMKLSLQAKLLRFLETQTFKRLGGLKDISVDLRIITATNQNLEQACQEGKFRKDLFYRINVCPIFIPPLRERKEDIIPLAHYFISDYNLKFRKQIKGLKKEAENLFLNYEWPGNVRELKNAIERAMIFEEGNYLSAKYLPIKLNSSSINREMLPLEISKKGISLKEIEKQLIIKSLKATKGNQTKAAKLLDISRDAFRYKMKKFNLKMNFK
ncbi:MAG: sigma-54-dependent transcriptional regulator [Candidatus Aminicenantia bacterium]